MEARAFSPVLKKLIPVLLTIIIVAGLYKYYGAWAYTVKNLAEFFRLTFEHLLLVLVSMAAAITVGVSLGTLMTRKGFAHLAPAIMGVHAVAPIVRNTYAGIQSVSKDVIEAATGMGMNQKQILFRIELPNALPVIMGGVRTSTAIIVGTAPLAFLIGGGGLGFWIFTGIALMDMGIMMAGAVPVALIAMLADSALARTEKMVVSKGIQAEEYQVAI
jgi:osmoprotectant transport system permease protein